MLLNPILSKTIAGELVTAVMSPSSLRFNFWEELFSDFCAMCVECVLGSFVPKWARLSVEILVLKKFLICFEELALSFDFPKRGSSSVDVGVKMGWVCGVGVVFFEQPQLLGFIVCVEWSCILPKIGPTSVVVVVDDLSVSCLFSLFIEMSIVVGGFSVVLLVQLQLLFSAVGFIYIASTLEFCVGVITIPFLLASEDPLNNWLKRVRLNGKLNTLNIENYFKDGFKSGRVSNRIELRNQLSVEQVYVRESRIPFFIKNVIYH
ncbi:hypothetical protein FF38_08031 [Lucilia cuprina]|uniref:Uncharacterized protein n=1 Tax=Lucilia cuprina TaxID=7375 RepID=A0A0L0BUC8_LUCCU|nr:hypothetical protein FF38_08031 [Lucilia cuprina]